MYSYIGKLILSFALALHPVAFAAEPAPAKPASASVKTADPVVIGVRAFNMIQGGKRLFLGLKAGANASDEEYLDRMAEQYKDMRLPIATAKDGMIWLQGLSKPIKIIDLKKGTFSYDGKPIELSMNDGIEQALDKIEATVFPKSAKLWNWLLPEANAQVDGMMIVAGMMGVGGLVMLANSCGTGSEAVGWQCGLGGFMGGFGLGYILTTLLMGNKSTPPSGMTCYPGAQGCQQVQLLGPNRTPINTIANCPGQGYSFNPALTQVPPAQAQYMGQQFAQFCSYPGMMGSMNTAYAAPVPAAQWPPVQRQVVAPPFAAYAVRSVSKIKAATVKTQASSIKVQGKQTPAVVPAGGTAK